MSVDKVGDFFLSFFPENDKTGYLMFLVCYDLFFKVAGKLLPTVIHTSETQTGNSSKSTLLLDDIIMSSICKVD